MGNKSEGFGDTINRISKLFQIRFLRVQKYLKSIINLIKMKKNQSICEENKKLIVAIKINNGKGEGIIYDTQKLLDRSNYASAFLFDNFRDHSGEFYEREFITKYSPWQVATLFHLFNGITTHYPIPQVIAPFSASENQLMKCLEDLSEIKERFLIS